MKTKFAAAMVLGLALACCSLRAAEKEGEPVKPAEAIEQRVSCEFVDTPILETLTYLRQIGKMNLLISDRARQADVKVNLSVNKMKIGDVLSWICQNAGLRMEAQEEAICLFAHHESEAPDNTPEPIKAGATFRVKLGNGNEIETDASLFNSKPQLLEKLVARFLEDQPTEKK